MATDTLSNNPFAERDSRSFSLSRLAHAIFDPLASLRLTVVLFALSIFLILVGTLAQVEKDIWDVITLYFRCWLAWVPFQAFFPPSFFEGQPPTIPGGFWFPGGKVLGLALAINLLSAHLIRFKVESHGAKLWAGFGAIGAGIAITWAVIAAGANSKGIQGDPWLPYSTQWIGYQGLLALAVVACGYATVKLYSMPLSTMSGRWARRLFLRAAILVFGLGFAALWAWTVKAGDAARPSDASLRILWQLTQGTVAAFALLAGCWIVFGRRAGMVLLHGGIGLMMFYELHVALTAIETQMMIAEGETTNFVQDIRTNELAIIESVNSKENHVVAIPRSLLMSKKPIDHADLPFTIEVDEYFPNAKLRGVSKKDKNQATAGNGLNWFPLSEQTSTGTDNDSRVDIPAAYVTLKSKPDNKVIGTYLTSILFSDDESDVISVGDKQYRLELRHKRYYKPYHFKLEDVRKEDYLGTSTPRNYASTVDINDPTRNVDEKKTIWMNNPLRFADETFYQSNYSQEKGTGHEFTTLSVVANSGWMMPYVACMLVAVGMLSHFLIMLYQFLLQNERIEISATDRDRASQLAQKMGIKPIKKAEEPADPDAGNPMGSVLANALAISVAVLAIAYIGVTAIPPSAEPRTIDLYRFGQIPVVSDGRAKPLDSAARSTLLAISGHTEIAVGEKKDKHTVPAIQWMLDAITESKTADNYEVFRIDNLELQETVGVKKREGMRYSRNEIRERDDELEKQMRQARKAAESNEKDLSVYQRKVLELGEKISTYENLKLAFGLQHRIRGKTEQQMFESFRMAVQLSEEMEKRGHPVFAIPPESKDDTWHIYARSSLLSLIDRVQQSNKEHKAVTAWDKIVKSYDDDDAKAFNRAVNDLIQVTESNPPPQTTPWIITLESYLNHIQPFYHADVLYFIAFILSALGWLVWTRGFNRMAFALLVVTLAYHSAALLARLIISGRPPVTNLYSSAVFIGWCCVVFALAVEVIYNMGIGNLVASVAGFATLQVAEGLAADGDTFTVLQAVLDTQFWLATHVTCITLGYATTYLAGLLGVAYIIRGVCTPRMTVNEGREIYRMIYGTICFSIFFSFVGTVLGGLWADDSWGRFWGWDPKENAALMIVLWNALVLHARWGGMVRERGLACLAVGGNIFVSWSWWGVNALGAGLHSYGFKKGTIQVLFAFIAVNMLIIAVGMLPKTMWWSIRQRELDTKHA